MNRGMMSIGLFLASMSCNAGDLFIEFGIYDGKSDYTHSIGDIKCDGIDAFGRCLSYNDNSVQVTGPFGLVEFGWAGENISASCFHLSMINRKDKGLILLCGVSYRFKL